MNALREAAQQALACWDTRSGVAEASEAFEALRVALSTPQGKWVGLDLAEMDEIINGNITITDSRLRDGVYGVVLDTMTTLMDKNNIEPWEGV